MAYDSVNVTPSSNLSLAAGLAQGASNFYQAYQSGVQQRQYSAMLQQRMQGENDMRQLQMQKLQQEINPVQVDIQKLSMLSKLSDANPEYSSLAKKQLQTLFDGLDSPTKLSYANSVLSKHLADQNSQPDYTKGSEQDPNFMGPKTPTVVGSQSTQLPGPVQPGQAPLSYDKPVMGYPPQGAQTQLPTMTPSDSSWSPGYRDTGYRSFTTPPQPGQPYEVGDGGYRKAFNTPYGAQQGAQGGAQAGAKSDPTQGLAYEDLSPAYQAALGGKVSLNPYEQKLLEKMISDRTANNIAMGRNATSITTANMNNMSKQELMNLHNEVLQRIQNMKDDTRVKTTGMNNDSREGIQDSRNQGNLDVQNARNAGNLATQKVRSANKAGGNQNLDEKSINKQIETLNKQMGDLRKPNSLTGMVPPDDMIQSGEKWYRDQIQALQDKKSQLKSGSSSAPQTQPSGLPIVAHSKSDLASAPDGSLVQWQGKLYKKQGKNFTEATR